MSKKYILICVSKIFRGLNMESNDTMLIAVVAIVIIAGIIGLAAFGGFFGTGQPTGQATSPTTTTGPAELQTIKIAGSTTVLPIAQQAAEAYMDKNANADIQVSGGGSSVGVKSAGEGTADIGMASRELKDSEKEVYPGLVQHVVARDGIALIVHKSNNVPSLTIPQIKGIYKGDYTNWNQVGGSNQEIVVIGRDSASGTREFFFDEVMDKEDFVSTMLEMNSNGAVKQQVSQTPGAIGYVGLGYVDNTVNAVKVNDGGKMVQPTVNNVINGDYPIARSLNMFTMGQPKGLAKNYINFILSSEGQKLVEDEGFVPLS
jgi:phosphate transport system substrate-binding protein